MWQRLPLRSSANPNEDASKGHVPLQPFREWKKQIAIEDEGPCSPDRPDEAVHEFLRIDGLPAAPLLELKCQPADGLSRAPSREPSTRLRTERPLRPPFLPLFLGGADIQPLHDDAETSLRKHPRILFPGAHPSLGSRPVRPQGMPFDEDRKPDRPLLSLKQGGKAAQQKV